MKTLAILATVLAAMAVIATFAMAYGAIFAHDNDLAGAAYLTLWLDFILGGTAAALWVGAAS
jgi:hypothetical protein